MNHPASLVLFLGVLAVSCARQRTAVTSTPPSPCPSTTVLRVENRTGAEVDILEADITHVVGTTTLIGTAPPGFTTFNVAPKPGVSYWARLDISSEKGSFFGIVGAENWQGRVLSSRWPGRVLLSRSCLPA